MWCRSIEDKSIKRFDNTTAALTSIADKGSRSVAETFDLPLIVCIVVWCGVVWCGVVWCSVVWCGVVWCGVVRFSVV